MKLRNKNYSLSDSMREFIKSKLPEFESGESIGTIYGALAGTALSMVILTAVTKSQFKKVNDIKKRLDETYNPSQRMIAEEMEKINRTLIVTSIGAGALGAGAGYYFLSKKLGNEKLASSIGSYLGKKAADAVFLKRKNRLEEIKLEYDDSLSYQQKILREELAAPLRKLNLTWTLGVAGGILMGGIAGEGFHKIKQTNKQ